MAGIGSLLAKALLVNSMDRPSSSEFGCAGVKSLSPAQPHYTRTVVIMSKQIMDDSVQ